MPGISTLGKIAVGLVFPIIGVAYYSQHAIGKKFARQPYYTEAIELIKQYTPLKEKLGGSFYMTTIDLSDSFNYHDHEKARAKIPVKGATNNATVMIYATKKDEKWHLDYMELEYPNQPKYKFYDSKLVK